MGLVLRGYGTTVVPHGGHCRGDAARAAAERSSAAVRRSSLWGVKAEEVTSIVWFREVAEF